LLLFVGTKLLGQAPSITSFSPSSGPAGSSMIITGSNFGSTPAANVVYFGGAKATITSASTTSLTVTVPAAATYAPISVTVNNGTAVSGAAFDVTFPDGNTVFSPSSMAGVTSLGLNKQLCYDNRQVVLYDFDGNGKTDVAVNDPTGNAIYIMLNNGNATKPYGATPSVTLATNTRPLQLTCADIDGDGLKDLLVLCPDGNRIDIFRNTSTGGTVSFAAMSTLTVASSAVSFAVGDLDGDGLPDIAVTNTSTTGVSVYKNVTSAGSIKFGTPVTYTAYQPTAIAIADMNGDGKPDLLYCLPSGSELDIMKNNSTPGTISLSAPVYFSPNFATQKLTVCDVDGDGKPDLLMTGSSGLEVVANTTPVSGKFSFAAPKFFPLQVIDTNLYNRQQLRGTNGTNPNVTSTTVTMGDIDGDGKADAIVLYSILPPTTEFSILRNLSTPGNIKFDVDEEYSSNVPESVDVGDVDGDGKPDIIAGTREVGVVDFIKNRVTEPTLTGYQISAGGTVTISGTNLLKTSSVVINGIPVTSFTINSATSITAMVAANIMGTIGATTPYGTATYHGFTNVKAPVITSFSPASGPVGTTVTITGANFGSSAANNVVYFGTSKATATVASSTSITVTVPYGSLYQPISVTTNNQTGYSAQIFNTTFQGAGAKFTQASFAPQTNSVPGYGSRSAAQADFDGDGNLDIVVASYGGTPTSNIFVYQNTGNKITPFSNKQTLTLTTGGNPSDVITADFNGDGKTDLLVVNSYSNTISVFQNTSTPGNITFAARQDFAAYIAATNLYLGDLDGDGKPDLVSIDATGPIGVISVYRNTSDNSTISFDKKVDYNAGGLADGLTLTDMDGDGKLDMIVGTSTGTNIFRNTSVTGAVSFASPTAFSNITLANGTGITAGDLDADGKPDLVVANAFGQFSVYKNISTAGNVALSSGLTLVLPANSIPQRITINDFDGDGKPDILVSNSNGTSVSLFKNESTSSALSFDTKVDYTTGNSPYTVASADFNNDGKPDMLVTTNSSLSTPALFLSKVNEPALTGYKMIAGDSKNNVKFTGSNLLNVTSVTINGTAVKSFTIVSDSVINVLTANTASGTVVATNQYGTGTLTSFVFYNAPVISSFSKGTVGNTVQADILGQYFTGVTSVAFDGVAAQSFTVVSATEIRANTTSSTFKTITITTPGGSVTYTVPVTPVISSISPASGGPGSVITITGSNFTGITSVTFGGYLAQSFNVTSPTSMTAIVGSGASGNVVVSNQAGSGSFAGFTFVAAPKITTFSPTIGGSGTQVTITGSNFTGATSVSFGGTAAQSFTVNSATSIIAKVGAGTNGTVSVTTAGGTANLGGFTFVPAPQITTSGSTTFTAGGSVTLTASSGANYTYQWTKDGANISGATASSYTATESGSYAVTINVGAYSISSNPITVNSVFTLPANNFTVSTMSATCKGQSDGAINIAASQSLNYTATVTASSINKSSIFTSNTSFAELAAGNYSVCITVSGHSDYQQCFDVVVTEPKDLSVYSTVNKSDNSLTLELSGADQYNITLNGTNYPTQQSSITLPLSKNSNTLSVSTDRLCQGIIQKIINISGNKAPYPNWFQDMLNVNLGDIQVATGDIRIYSTNDGRLVFTQKIANQSGVIRLDLTNLNFGVYSLVLNEDGVRSTFKIIKK